MMTMLDKLRETLDRSGITYDIREHPVAYTAQEVAALEHVPGRELAKVVILDVDGKHVMAVLPASGRVDFERVRRALDATSVKLASEAEFARDFPGCETGAMPPFGNFFGLDVIADSTLERDEAITFNAGTHRRTVRMGYQAWKGLVNPRVLPIATHPGRRAAA